jgi:hypothetical protein
LHQECLEMPGQEIGDEEGGHHRVALGFEGLVADIEGKAVRAFYALDTMVFADPVERAACSAIGIADEDVLKAFPPGLQNGALRPRARSARGDDGNSRRRI